MTVGFDSFTGASGITNDPCAEFVQVAVWHIQHDPTLACARSIGTNVALYAAHLLRVHDGRMNMTTLCGTICAALHMRYNTVRANVEWFVREGWLDSTGGVISWAE